MAILTTVDGHQITFNPKAVSALTNHNASTGQVVTTVYGITNAAIDITETAQAFMSRLGIANNFAQLTRPNGSPVWLNGSAVSSLRPPLPNQYVAGVNTVVSTDGLTQGVTETPAAVTAAINAHGGNL